MFPLDSITSRVKSVAYTIMTRMIVWVRMEEQSDA